MFEQHGFELLRSAHGQFFSGVNTTVLQVQSWLNLQVWNRG